jgi:cytochrome P450
MARRSDGRVPTHEADPPTHDGLPVIGNTHQLVRDQDGLYEAAARRGDVVRLRILGMGDFYLVSAAELVETVLTDTERFRKATASQEDLGDLLGRGLVLSEGALWERQRQRIQPAFHADRVRGYADAMVAETRSAADEWTGRPTVDVEDEMKGLTLRILTRSIFGSDLEYDERGIRETVSRLQEPGQPLKQPIARMVPKWVPIPMWRRYRAGIREMEGVVREFVDARREALAAGRAAPDDDLLSMLLTATDEEGDRMPDELVRDELMTFLFAGHETTATALTFTWYLLSRHPAVERRLVAELEEVLGDRPPTPDDLPALEYTGQVFREAMRLYPPVPLVPRETATPVELGGYALPEGATVAPAQWTVHRDGRYWEAPSEFRPERFAGDGDEDRPRFAYFPFGGGPRQCIGRQFALLEGQLVLATLARRFHLELVSDPDVDLSVSITTRPLDPIEMRVEPRND